MLAVKIKRPGIFLKNPIYRIDRNFFFGHFEKPRRFHKTSKIQPSAVILKLSHFLPLILRNLTYQSYCRARTHRPRQTTLKFWEKPFKMSKKGLKLAKSPARRGPSYENGEKKRLTKKWQKSRTYWTVASKRSSELPQNHFVRYSLGHITPRKLFVKF